MSNSVSESYYRVVSQSVSGSKIVGEADREKQRENRYFTTRSLARSHIIAKLVRCHAAKIASHLPHTLSRRNVSTNSCPAFVSVATRFTTLDSTRPQLTEMLKLGKKSVEPRDETMNLVKPCGGQGSRKQIRNASSCWLLFVLQNTLLSLK